MSIRLLARDLYRLHREVEELEKQLEETAPGQRDAIKEKLRRAKAEKEELRKILNGQLDRPA